MVVWASHVSVFAGLHGLIRSAVVLTIIDAIANLTIRDASEVFTSEFS